MWCWKLYPVFESIPKRQKSWTFHSLFFFFLLWTSLQIDLKQRNWLLCVIVPTNSPLQEQAIFKWVALARLEKPENQSNGSKPNYKRFNPVKGIKQLDDEMSGPKTINEEISCSDWPGRTRSNRVKQQFPFWYSINNNDHV